MSAKQRPESVTAQTEQPLRPNDAAHRALDFSGPWLSSCEAQLYVPCRTLKGWYEWRRRHGIIARANGSVAKADLDRALSLRGKRPRRMAAASLANLKRRSA